ncbi:MAG: hypothetical protein AAF696_31850 [Bacteroidota bacterium]
MSANSLHFASLKNPWRMRVWGVLSLLIFVAILSIVFSLTPEIEYWSLSWTFLFIPLYLFVMWRLFRAVLMRCLSLDNHVFKLSLHPEEKIAEVWVYGKWFETEKFTFGFEELTAVSHKSNEPKLHYSFPAINYSLRKHGLMETIGRSILWILTLNAGFRYQSLGDSLIAERDPKTNKKDDPDQVNCDSRHTALSLVIGKNEGSFMMMPTYGWRPTTLQKIVKVCEEQNMRTFDKRPFYEKKVDIYL